MNTFEQLKKILVETFGKEDDKIQLTTSLRDDMEMDSLDFVEVMMEVEESFGVSIDDEKSASFVTIQDVVNYIDQNK